MDDDEDGNKKKRNELVPCSPTFLKRLSPQSRRMISWAWEILPVDRIYCVMRVRVSPEDDPEPKYEYRGRYVPVNLTYPSKAPTWYGRALDRAWAEYEKEWRLRGKNENHD